MDNQLENRLRVQIGRIVHEKGHDLDDSNEFVRRFFFESQINFYRNSCVELCAWSLGEELANDRAKADFWQKIGKDMGIDRRTRGKWGTGQEDVPIPILLVYFAKLGVSCPTDVFSDATECIRYAIARTLTSIRVFPPRRPAMDLALDAQNHIKLNEPWRYLRRHPRYRNHGDLNQHAVDCVYRKFGPVVWVAASEVGAISRRIENEMEDTDPLYWPYAIFKLATLGRIESSNKPKENPFAWIWDNKHPLYATLWR